jgi:WD40-like Beta Propeller Repeat
LGVLVMVFGFGVWTPTALASFPGRDGNLVVATGSGLESVNPASGVASFVCADAALCGDPAKPRFSPNGAAIAFTDTATDRPVVVASDGSCLWCLLGARLTTLTGSESAFEAGGRSVTLARNGLWSVSLTGGKPRRLVKGRVGDAVWSVRGVLALVRGGWIWVGRPGHGNLRRLARGDSPSFSPNGARLAFVRAGYVRILAVHGGGQRRLVEGESPAWSPDGRQIAYIGPASAVEIVAVRGGRPQRVGAVSGSALDWQPLPAAVHQPCTPPRGSTVLASSSGAVVYSHGRDHLGVPDVYGCLEALDRTQLLATSYDSPYFATFVAVRLAGRFVVVESEYSKGGAAYDATMYDLSTGAATELGEAGELYGGGYVSGLDSLVLDSSGFAAWRQTTQVPFPEPISAVSCPSPSLCVAGDWAGDILTSTNPASGRSAWSMAPISAGFGPEVSDLSCPSASLCLGLGSNYRLLSSADPTGGASAWAQVNIDPEDFLDALSCPSASLCVAVDVGDVLISTDPTGGATAWARTSIGQGIVGYDISCPSVSECVATVTQGDILSSTDPTGGASAWTKTQISQGNVGAISCPSVLLCVVSGPGGSVLTSTDPTGGASAWNETQIDPGNGVTAISCPSVSLCVAVDADGNILTSRDPAAGVGAWSSASVEPGRVLYDISCPSLSLCVVGDDKGDVLTSTDPTGGANAWSIAGVDMPPCASQTTACLSDQLYARDDQGTRAADSAPLGDGNLIDDVALDGDSLVLNWTRDGTPQQLELR